MLLLLVDVGLLHALVCCTSRVSFSAVAAPAVLWVLVPVALAIADAFRVLTKGSFDLDYEGHCWVRV